MSAQEVLLLLRAGGKQPDDEARQAVAELVNGTTEAERAAVVSVLRRGASWDEATAWLAEARMDAGVVEDGVYDRALALFGGSVLLEWRECLNVAPALTYRPDGLSQNG